MGKIRVLIVDDSPFSRKVMAGTLDQTVFEVCGFAENGWEAVEKFKLLCPDVVTMDMNLPDMDGLVCSREILSIDSNAKIVMASAMRDDSLISRGYSIGVQAFLQKPIKAPELLDTLRQVCLNNRSNQEWQEKYLQYFISSLQQNLLQMAGLESDVSTSPDSQPKFTARGIAIILGITGKQTGRIILNATEQTAQKLTQRILDGAAVDEEDVLNSIAEVANIIGGHSVSVINNIYRGVELRLTPPGIMCGNSIDIINPKLSSFNVIAETEIGTLNLNIGFAGGK
ncbi:response regulator [Dendrosporobacter sp. 1207_IL3150]|uniref:response regulator n=1 Tax=Dendrosporobacter sp. 1207_IL3150 TaxID=3084054 RepID=UPI002FDAC3B4